jgi:predicted transcriptional regulator
MATETVGTAVLELKVDDAKYNASVDKNEQKAKQLQVTFDKVSSDISKNAQEVAKLTSNLFGDSVIQKAHQYATAVAAVGGAAKLSAAEQKAAFDSVTAAIDKLKARGESIPASFSKLADATKPLDPVPQKFSLAQKASDALKGSLVQLASGFALGNLITSAVSGIVSWGKEAFDAAGKTVDMANKTGLSTETIQRMAFVAKQTGAELETFTNAAFKLGVQMSTGTGSTRKAVEALGLSFDDLRKKKPDEQFDLVVAALGKMEDAQQRNAIAVQLFGGKSKDILSAIKDGYADIANQADVASDAQIRALDAAGDALDRFIANRKANLTAALGTAALAGEGASEIGLGKTLALLISGGPQAAATLAAIGAAAADTAKKTAEAIPAPEKTRSYVAELKEAETAYKNLSKSTLDEVRAAQKLGATNDEIINQFSDKGVTEGVLKLITQGTADLTKGMNEAAREAKKLAEAQDQIASVSVPLVGQQRDLVAWLAKRGASESDIAKTLGVTATQVKEVIAIEKVRTDALKVADKQAQEFVDHQRKAMDATAKAILESVAAIQKLDQELSLQGTSGLNRELIQIEQNRTAAVKAIENVGEVESEITRERRAKIDEFYDHQRRVALGTMDTLVERMHAAGILTRSELQQQADNFKRDYDQMLASGLYTTEQLNEAWQRYREAQKKLHAETLAQWMELGQVIQAIARNIPGVAGQLTSSVGGAITQIANVMQANRDWAENTKHTTAEIIGHYGAAIDTVVGFGRLLFDVFKPGGMIDKLTGHDLDRTFSGPLNQFITAHGGVSNIRTQGITAGFNTDLLLTTDSAKKFQQQSAMFDQALQKSNDLLQRYGLTWKDLGANIQKANIDQITRQLIQDSHALYLAGVTDFDKRVKAMSSGLNQMVLDAVQTGQKIPKALQPMLETLIRSKGLSEEAAKALLGMADDGAPSFDEIKAAAERYGIEISQLGPKINQLRINDIAKQIVADWTLLQKAGADTNTVLVGMQKSVQDVVTEALKAGLKIPEGMKPIIEAMIRAGLLTDEDGKKLTDLGKLEFEKPLVDAIGDLIKALDKLIDKFSKVGDAAEEGFGRAGAAGGKATGEVAVPRGAPPAQPGDQTGTPTGSAPPGTSSPPTDAPSPGRATPRNGIAYFPPGTQILDDNGNVVMTFGGEPSDPRMRFSRGGVVYASEGGWRDFARSEGYGWRPKGEDVIPAMLAIGEGVANADTGMPRLEPAGLDALNTGQPLPPRLLPKLFDSSVLRTAAMVGGLMASGIPAMTGISMPPTSTRPAPYRSTISHPTTPGPQRPPVINLSVTVAGGVISSSEQARQVGTALANGLRRDPDVRALLRTHIKSIVETGV